MRILFVGNLESGSTSRMRYQAFQRMGHVVSGIQSEDLKPPTGAKWFVRAVTHRLRIPLDEHAANKEIRSAVAKDRYDLVWIDKGNTIWPSTLRLIKSQNDETMISGYSPDDMAAKHNSSIYFVRGLPYYDAYFTTKTYGVRELESLGLRKAFFSGNAYDPATHRPVEIDVADRREYGAPVGFIGTYEIDRARSISHLVQNGIDVKIRGNMWGEAPRDLRLPQILPAIYGNDYAKAICAIDINLCFLRKMNRDRQTQRSVELPAAGAFMLAERTDEHLDLFQEGKEAEFFGSDEELLDKVRFYLSNPDLRRKIAAAGRDRCLRSGYSYEDRLRAALKQLEESKSNGRRAEKLHA